MLLRDVTPILMCGGEGKRLRPFSTKKCPKPFIRTIGRESLFQKTISRVSACASPIILTRKDLKSLITAQAGNIKMVLEPVAKNTAPAIIKACLESENQDTPYLFMPADHDISDISPLLEAIKNIDDKGDVITLFGISPTSPETRYGYIGQSPVAFHEKPNKEMAKSYIEKGYLWNSGMILASPRTILNEAKKHVPELLSLVKDNNYEEIAPISFDYAILEKSSIIKCVRVDLTWRDVGTLKSYLSYIYKPYDNR
ncbi:MAG: hypothetical protein JKX72_00185 [Robiginitomaculum sp.]|nr:hypothetical protein [Robiginitomaculum sp.]